NLRLVLAEPEMETLIAADPRVGRILRPLCHLLGFKPPPSLRLPKPTPKPRRKPKPRLAPRKYPLVRDRLAPNRPTARPLRSTHPRAPPAWG
ncbi:MAG: hypothetical protein ACYCZB_02110, partial [Acidiphilium sp.]